MGDTITSLRLLELRGLLEEVVRQAHDGLHTVARALPGLPDHERKRALLAQLHASRQQLQRLAVATAWSAKARAVAECRRVLEAAALHGAALQESADQLAFLHGELAATTAPAYDVPTALHVVEHGSYELLPKCIEELAGMPPKPEAPEDAAAAAGQLGMLLRSKLLEETRPEALRVQSLDGPVATLASAQGTYVVRLTLVPAPTPEVTLAQYGGETDSKEGRTVTVGGGAEVVSPHEAGGGDVLGPAVQTPPDARDGEGNGAPETAGKGVDSAAAGAADPSVPSHDTRHSTNEWRWRVLSIELLPDWHRRRQGAAGSDGDNEHATPPSPASKTAVALEEWIRSMVEQRMWVASDLAALSSLGRLDLVRFPEQPRRAGGGAPATSSGVPTASLGLSDSQHGGGGAAVARLAPVKEEEEVPAVKEAEDASAPGSQQLPTTVDYRTTGRQRSNASGSSTATVPPNLPPGFSPELAQPLVLMHRVLHRAAVRSALGAALVPAARQLEAEGPWAGQLSLERARDVGTGIRLRLWPSVALVSAGELSRLCCGGDGGDIGGNGTAANGGISLAVPESSTPGPSKAAPETQAAAAGPPATTERRGAGDAGSMPTRDRGLVLELGLAEDEDGLAVSVSPELGDPAAGSAVPLRAGVTAATPDLPALLRRVCAAAAAQQLSALRAALVWRWGGDRRGYGENGGDPGSLARGDAPPAVPMFELQLDPPRLRVTLATDAGGVRCAVRTAGPTTTMRPHLPADAVIVVDNTTGLFVLESSGNDTGTENLAPLRGWLEAAGRTAKADTPPGLAAAGPGLAYVGLATEAVGRHVLAADWRAAAARLQEHVRRVLGESAATRAVPSRVLDAYVTAEAMAAAGENAVSMEGMAVAEPGLEMAAAAMTPSHAERRRQTEDSHGSASHSGALAVDLPSWPGDAALDAWLRQACRSHSAGAALVAKDAAERRHRQRRTCGPVLASVLLRLMVSRGQAPHLRCDVLLQECSSRGAVPLRVLGVLPFQPDARLPDGEVMKTVPDQGRPLGLRKRGREEAGEAKLDKESQSSLVSTAAATITTSPALDLVGAVGLARSMRAWCQLAVQLAALRLAAREAWLWDAVGRHFRRSAVVPAPRGLLALDAWARSRDMAARERADAKPQDCSEPCSDMASDMHAPQGKIKEGRRPGDGSVTFTVRDCEHGAWEAAVPSGYFASWQRRFRELGVDVEPAEEPVPADKTTGSCAAQRVGSTILPGDNDENVPWTSRSGRPLVQSPPMLQQTADGLAFAGTFADGESVLAGTAGLLSAIRLHCFLSRVVTACELVGGTHAHGEANVLVDPDMPNGHHGGGRDSAPVPEAVENGSAMPAAEGQPQVTMNEPPPADGGRMPTSGIVWTVPGGGSCQLVLTSLHRAEFAVSAPCADAWCDDGSRAGAPAQNGTTLISTESGPKSSTKSGQKPGTLRVKVEWVPAASGDAARRAPALPPGTSTAPTKTFVACRIQSTPALPEALTTALEAAVERGDEAAFLDGLAATTAVAVAAAGALSDAALRASELLPAARRWLGAPVCTLTGRADVQSGDADPGVRMVAQRPHSNNQRSRLGLAPQTVAVQVCQGGRAVELEVGGYVGGLTRLALRFGRLRRGTPRANVATGLDGPGSPGAGPAAWALALCDGLLAMDGAARGDSWLELGLAGGIRKKNTDPCLAATPGEILAGKRVVVWLPQAATSAAIASVLRAVAGT